MGRKIMSDASLEKRLRKLKMALAHRQFDREIKRRVFTKYVEGFEMNLMRSLIGHYLADPQLSDPIAAYARVLGYNGFHEFNNAVEENPAEVEERQSLAVRKLLAKFDVDDDAEWDTVIDALERMEAGLPKSYRKKLRWEAGQSESYRVQRRTAA